MSERYPAISQLIAENRIPEFDCLYLDMNGIIHNCTHKDSDSPTFRMTEDKMFIAIFNYIEHLYGKIKPKKLFFMAVDGVAPRAKMNQQRSRRFRTARDAEEAKEKAIREGVEMPKEDPFDSNCITPGTEFMAKLTTHLKYFINKKVSEDVEWQGVDIVLSGHEVPGEGEHKIMEYIRQAKAQPDYNSNVRHCLYGLDADLIMLGLLSHDPHFCLLREEVTFGRQNQKKSKELEHQNFYLMHLCIVREYLELEFQELKKEGVLQFPFDMERVIDDFILMAFFVGNDFLPNLPNLHINEGALAWMFSQYKEVLPKLGGYINERGTINLTRLGKLLSTLSDVEFRFFEAEYSDERWINAKRKNNEPENPAIGDKLTITPSQREILNKVKKYVTNYEVNGKGEVAPYDFPSSLPARDRKFVEQLADDLHVPWTTITDEHDDRFLRLQLPKKDNDDDQEDGDGDVEGRFAALRVLKKYEKAPVKEATSEEVKQTAEAKYDMKFQEWKDKYYREKFGWGLENKEELRKLTENYVQGLQWVLYYYYRGVASWPWFFHYHYAPMISDIKEGLNADMNFELGQPFYPFQQLMGVLPDRSKKIVPPAYHDLMTSPNSPIIDFYPRDFELDMNGKKMDWEAVVKIPFIDEKRLLAAMATREHLLTDDENNRNSFGVSLRFIYSTDVEYIYPSSLPGIFPDIQRCHCIENVFDLPTMEGLEPVVGLVDGVKLGVNALAGFPSLKTLPHYGHLAFHGVNVFQQDSRNESMVVTLTNTEDNRASYALAKKRLGQRVYVGYPFLQEAKVVRMSDEMFDYVKAEGGHVATIPHPPAEIERWQKKAQKIETYYSKRMGMMIGGVERMIHVQLLRGLIKTDQGDTVKEFGEIPGIETDYALQLTVDQVVSEDERFIERKALPIEREFPVSSRAFFLGEYHYGAPINITGHENGRLVGRVLAGDGKEPEFGYDIVRNAEGTTPYTSSYQVAKALHLSPLTVAKITSSFTVIVDNSRVNLGLNLKFEAKKQKVLGYSRRGATGWEFSDKAISLLHEYMIKFPEFIAGIQRKPQGDGFDATDFYPADIAAKKIKEIQAWLKSIEAKNFERVPLEAEQLDSDQVKLVEQAADELMAGFTPLKARTMKDIPRNALLKPADAGTRLGNQRFSLGDRAVYAQESGKVPIGIKGTVVGLTRTARTIYIDILFDVSFLSGSSLGDRCSPFRGSTVPATSVLNLSDRQLLAHSQASLKHIAAQQQQQQQAQLLQRQRQSVGFYGAPSGPGHRGQMRDAPPPPPLRDSFSGAVNGSVRRNGPKGALAVTPPRQQQQQHLPFQPRGRGGTFMNGFAPRGRGSGSGLRANNHGTSSAVANGHGAVNGNYQRDTTAARGAGGRSFLGGGRGGGRGGRGSYVSVDRIDPDTGLLEHNPNFRPKSYNQTPPPPMIISGAVGRGGPAGNRGRGGFMRGGGRGQAGGYGGYGKRGRGV